MLNILPFTSEEYEEWNSKFEDGYGQARPGVSTDQVERERAAIPKIIRYTYIFKKYIGNGERES